MNRPELHAEMLLQEALLLSRARAIPTRPVAKLADFNTEKNFKELNL